MLIYLLHNKIHLPFIYYIAKIWSQWQKENVYILLNFFYKFKLVHWGKESENQLAQKQNFLVMADQTSAKIFTRSMSQ